MAETPLFSIITITRNNLAGLRKTAESVSAQSYSDFEWIVIDGASSDGSAEFLKTTGADYISEPDKGIYDAMNKGLEKARGQYVWFMNAGDIFTGNNVLEEIAFLPPSDFIYGDALESRDNGAPFYKRARPYTKAHHGMFTHHQAMIYGREMLQGIRFNTDYSIAADYDFTLRALQQAQAVRFLPFALCLFESGGISQTHPAQGRREEWRIRKNLGIAGSPYNFLRYIQQTASAALKKHLPRLYDAVR